MASLELLPSDVWQLRTTTFQPARLPRLMGIVNVTPNSFSDGGRFLDPTAAIEHGRELVRQGAEILDVGGESTQPYAESVAVDEELRRVLPVVAAPGPPPAGPVSIDTSKAAVARAALEAGAEIINDVTGLEGDPDMVPLARTSQAGLCIMHMQGTPATMQVGPTYGNVVAEVADYLAQRRERLIADGIDPARICLDPGIGFGKTHAHNLELLRACGPMRRLGAPILVGPSRKGFIGHVLGDKQADRTAGTVGVVLALAAQRVPFIRVHDVAAARQALLLFAATGGLDV